jgi:hypothetical protein
MRPQALQVLRLMVLMKQKVLQTLVLQQTLAPTVLLVLLVLPVLLWGLLQAQADCCP